MQPTIDQMCKGLAGANIRRTIENANSLKRIHRQGTHGYSPKRTHRYIGEIPDEFQLRNWTCRDCYKENIQGPHLDLNQYGLGCAQCKWKGKVPNPYYNYFHPDHDKHERTKHRYQFFNKIAPQLRVVDKT